jgi:hypothetical protein
MRTVVNAYPLPYKSPSKNEGNVDAVPSHKKLHTNGLGL